MDKQILIHSAENGRDLCHHGVEGQKWGNRKYQYEDGSLTPEGRIHYGVGEARNRASNSAQAIKARSKAEIARIKAETKAYKQRKKADNAVEIEKIKAQRDIEKSISKENRDIAKQDFKNQRDMIDAASDNSEENESKGVKALKVVGSLAVAAGISYLAYKYIKEGVSDGIAKFEGADAEKGSSIVKEIASKPASSVSQKGSDIVNKAKSSDMSDYISKLQKANSGSSEAVRKAKEKVLNDSLNKKKDFIQNKMTSSTLSLPGSKQLALPMKNTANAATKSNTDVWDKYHKYIRSIFKHSLERSSMGETILIHSAVESGYVICHHGIKGQKWGVRRWQYEDGSLTPEGREILTALEKSIKNTRR